MLKLFNLYNKNMFKRDVITDDHSLWKRYSDTSLDENQIMFLSECMKENLNHARHAENERLTFNSIFLALVAGALAFSNNFTEQISFFIYLAMTFAGFLSMILTAKWNNTFSRHIFYAQQCYILIHKHYFGDGEAPDENDKKTGEFISGLNDLPMYSFRIYSPISYTRLGKKVYRTRTRVLYNTFYFVIQIMLITCTILSFIQMIG